MGGMRVRRFAEKYMKCGMLVIFVNPSFPYAVSDPAAEFRLPVLLAKRSSSSPLRLEKCSLHKMQKALPRSTSRRMPCTFIF